MQVVTISILEAFSWLILPIGLILSFLTKLSVLFAYINIISPIFLICIIIWSIPANLNWSKNLYGHLFSKVIILVFFTIVIYAIEYKYIGLIDSLSKPNKESFLKALYFSITTWTTLGFGDIIPSYNCRLLASAEALTGTISIPLIFAMAWFWIEQRLNRESLEENEFGSLTVQQDDHFGWIEIRSGVPTEIKQKFTLNPCKNCGNDKVRIRRYFQIFGVVSPLPKYGILCKCGNFVGEHYTAISAAVAWNKKNKVKS